MNEKAINYGKSVTAIFDALVSAGVDTEEALGCLEAPEALVLYGINDDNADDRLYQLLAAQLSDEQLAAFKSQLEDAIKLYDDPERANQRLVEDFITASCMQGTPPEEMAEDVAKIMEALKNGEEIKIPRMEDTWYADGAHGS